MSKKSKKQKGRTIVASDADLSFDPMSLIESSISSKFDSSVISQIDERQMNWAPNVASWIMEPEYLGIKTIYPHQLQVMLKLFGDVCPWCSDWDFYTQDFAVDTKIADIQDRVQLLNDGICPKCNKTKLDAYREGYWYFPHEIDLLWGMRCKSVNSLVFSEKGLVLFKDVQLGDKLTHGVASKKFNSGVLPSLTAITELNWGLNGAKESHVVPTLNENFEFQHKLLKECQIGDVLVLHSPKLWPSTNKVSKDLARLLGYLVSDGWYTTDRMCISCSSPEVENDIQRCAVQEFGKKFNRQPCQNTDKCWNLTMCNKFYRDKLLQLGLTPERSHTKFIPDCVLQSSKEVVCEFLAGLFGGDGGVFAESDRKVLLYYTTVSKTLMEQTRLLLLNLGIVTRLAVMQSNGFKKANTYIKNGEAPPEGVKISYTLSTKSSNFVKIFKDNVRLVEEKKLAAYGSLAKKSRIVVPTPIGNFRTDSPTFPPKLKTLLDQGYHFVRIKKIEEGSNLEMMDVHVPETNLYTADGFVHHNSGKSAVAGMLGSYTLHRFLRVPDPASYFGLLKGSLLAMRFVALTAGQANETIWGQFQRSVENCTWFGQYHDFLKQYENKYGMELQKWLSTVFHYPHKGIIGYFVGASIDKSRGRTSIFSAFDEIGWWLGGKDAKLANAKETYTAYEKASRTIRNAAMPRFLNGDYNIPTALLCAVSSTSSKDDFIMSLIRGSKLDKKKVGSHKASWEVNPEFAANPDELRDERENNPKGFARDYGSVPPYANDPFIDNEDLVIRAATLDRPHWPITQETGKIGEYLSAEAVEKNQTIPYVLAMDLSFNHCGYAAALLKLKEDDFSVVQLAGLFSIYPDKQQVIDLNMTFENLVKLLCEKLNIRLVLFDQWQSKSQIQAIKAMDIKSQDYSLTYQNFDFFRTQLGQGKLEICKPETPLGEVDSAVVLEDVLYPKPYLHLLWQLLSVSEVGNKIGKGEGHDDLFRAVVLGATFLWNEDWKQMFEYKGGMMSYMSRTKGRLAMAGASLSSGQPFTINNQTNTVFGQNKRALGTISPRSGGR